jgi:hypothetical protein
MKNSIKSILWKIYFWITLANGTFVYLWQSFSRFWEVIDLIIFSTAILGLFAFIWKRAIFPKLFWKIYFFVQMFWNIFYLYLLPLPEKITKTIELSQFNISTIAIGYYVPLFFALYLYGFKPNKYIKD